MKKTISINISGFAFIIEEDAYAQLKKYLDTIRSYFTTADGVDEIMTDIEIRIAEIFRERLDSKREVVDSTDVDEVISILGKPEAFVDGEEPARETSTSQESSSSRKRNRRLFRDGDRKTIGGVASGIGAYFGVDPVWIRLLFVVLAIGGLSGVPIYIILWIIMPEARTAAEKLEMHGEPVTAENIGKKVNETFESVKKNVNDLADSETAARVSNDARNGIESFFVFLGKLILLLLRAIVKIVGVLLIFITVIVLVSLLAAFMGLGSFQLITVGSSQFPIHMLHQIGALAISPPGAWPFLFIASIVVVGLPLLGLMYAGIHILFGLKWKVRGVGAGLFIIWLIGLGMLIFTGISTGRDFQKSQKVTESVPLRDVPGDTLHIRAMPDVFFERYDDDDDFADLIRIESDKIVLGTMRLDIVEHPRDTVYEVVVTRSAHGSDKQLAHRRAEQISYSYQIIGKELSLQPYIEFPRESLIRNQRIKVEVRVPAGKSVYLDPSLSNLLYDVKNVSNTYDRDMVGHTWTMLSEGLTCLQCEQYR